MSSNCPPQLQLTLPANTTSFKRSFEQFGFDLESPVGGGDPGTGGSSSRRNIGGSSLSGNERNKRARSASSLSDGNDSLRSSRSSTFASGSSDTSVSEDSDSQPGPSALTASRPATMTPIVGLERSFDPPRLPTPDLPEIQDIEMPDYQLESDAEQLSTEQTTGSIENYRLSLSRFNSFDSHIAALRRSRSPSLHRPPTPPPTLPPLSLTEESASQNIFLESSTEPLHSPPVILSSGRSEAAPTFSTTQQRPSNSNRDDTPTHDQETPPRLPAPVHHSTSALTAPYLDASPSESRPPVINLDVEGTTSRDDDDDDYVSFRERLNNAVDLLEADDLHSFRERLSSALDAVRPRSANRANRTSSNTQEDRERSVPPAFSSGSMSRSSSLTSEYGSGGSSITQRNGSESSNSWRSALMNPGTNSGSNTRPTRLRDFFGASSSSSGPSSLRLLETPQSRSGSSAPALLMPSLPTTPLDLGEETRRDDNRDVIADDGDNADENQISSTTAISPGSSSRPAFLFPVSHRPAPTSLQPSHPARSSRQPSVNSPSNQSRPMQPLLLRRQSSQSVLSNNSMSSLNSFNRELARWFEDAADQPGQGSSSGATSFHADRNADHAPESERDLDEEQDLSDFRYLARNEMRRRSRQLILPPSSPSSSPRNASSTSLPARTSTSGLVDRLNFDEEEQDATSNSGPERGSFEAIIASFRREVGNSVAAASRTASSPLIPASSIAAAGGFNSTAPNARAPPSLSSLIARENRDSLEMDVDLDPWAVEPSRDMINLITQRRAEARRYRELGLHGPREATEEREERRRNVNENERSISNSAGYRLTAHDDDSRWSSSTSAPVRWQLRWNEALEQSLDVAPPGEDGFSDIERELSESERIWRISRRMGHGLRHGASSNSTLYNENNAARTGLSARSQASDSDMLPRFLDGGDTHGGHSSSSNSLAYRRARSRIPGSTRPSASNSLMTENAAELRRQSAHADLMDHLGSHGHSYEDSTSNDYNHLRLSLSRRPDAPRNDYVRSGSLNSPVLPPLSYQYRSPSPGTPQPMSDILDAADRELEAQESREEPRQQRSSRRPTSLSWLPPAQNTTSSSSPFLPTPTFSSLGLDGIDPNEDDSSPPGERFRRRSLVPWGGPLSRTSSSRSPSRNARPDPAPRGHTHSSSWSSFSRDRAAPDSMEFFDSQRSSISDMARTITGPGNGAPPRNTDSPFASMLATIAPYRAASALLGSLESSNRRAPASAPSRAIQRSSSQGHRSILQRPSNPPPFIPPPDLGDMFVPDGISSGLNSPDRPEFERMTSTGYDQSDLLGFGLDALPSRNGRPPSPGPRPTHQTRTSLSTSANASSGGALGRYTEIDVDSFAPGPFRNTMQRLIDQERSRNPPSEPPSIPPLTFDDDDHFSIPSRLSRNGDSLDYYNPRTTNHRRNESSGALTSNAMFGDPPGGSHPTSSASNRDPFARRAQSSTSLNRPPQPRHAAAHRLRSPERRHDDLHSLMISRARMEASLLDGSVPTGSSSDLAGLNHAIDVLRPDGLSETRSHQLINRYRETRNANTGSNNNPLYTTTSLWGNLESDSNSNNSNNARSPRYPNTSAWYRRLSDNALNAMASSTATDARAGATATRRRPGSPARGLERSEALHERYSSSNGRGRFSAARAARHRLPELSVFGERDLPSSNDILGPFARLRRGRNTFSLGDFIRDEDFDTSYEGLISLEATIGEAKPRSTPEHVVAGLEAGFFKDWATAGCDQRCPICLDDYKQLDPVLKLNDCTHWLHKGCLEQWLKGASTCPVCRKAVKGAVPHRRHHFLRAQERPSFTNEAGPSRNGNPDRSTTNNTTNATTTAPGSSNNAQGDNSNTNANASNTDTPNTSSTGRRTHPRFMLPRQLPP